MNGHRLHSANNHGIARFSEVQGNNMAALATITLAIFGKNGGFFQNCKQGLFLHESNRHLGRSARQGRPSDIVLDKRKVGRRVGLTLILTWLLLPSFSRAQDAFSVQKEPPRFLATLCPGGAVRLNKNDDFGQTWLGPAFVDAMAGYVFPGGSAIRHGVGLGASWNLTSDGGYSEPIYSGQQWVLMVSYLALLDVRPDWVFTGRVGPEFAITSSSKPWGIDLAVGAGYLLLAGLGAYAELGIETVFGANSSLHPLASLKIGVLVDYEALPKTNSRSFPTTSYSRQ